MKLLYLSALTFVFVASSALALGAGLPALSLPITASQKESFTPIPVLAKNAGFPVLSAQAALAIDVDSKVTLYEKNADTPYLPASTTKIVTALVSLDSFPQEGELTVPKTPVEGQKMGLVPGEKITALNLLYGLLVYSANDAAEALAANYPGGRPEFILAMNKKARELSLVKSNFTNPSGLDGDGQIVSTARDLVRVSEAAMENPLFAKIVGTREVVVKSADGKITYNLKNINELLGKVDGVSGIKTGWTENARENLVTYVDRGGHKVLIAMLGSQDRFGETKELIDWIYQDYSWQSVSLPYSP